MAEPFLGQIQQFGFNFAPRGWAFCNGQLMSIAQNTALFSLLGTMYGGDGVSTFGLPDMRSRTSLHFGQGNGLSNYTQGQVGGVEGVTLITGQMPSHNHSLNASSGAKFNNVPAGNHLGGADIYTASALDSVMDPLSIGNTGGNQPHENRQPYLVINWCISLEGIFPSRN
jgi:microcystin-dependent protein